MKERGALLFLVAGLSGCLGVGETFSPKVPLLSPLWSLDVKGVGFLSDLLGGEGRALLVVLGRGNATATFLDVNRRAFVGTLTYPNPLCCSIPTAVLDPRGEWAFLGGSEGIFLSSKGEVLKRIALRPTRGSLLPESVVSASISPRGTTVAFTTWEGGYLYVATNGSVRSTLVAPRGSFSSVAFSDRVLFVAIPGRVLLLDPETLEIRSALPLSDSDSFVVPKVVSTPDGLLAAFDRREEGGRVVVFRPPDLEPLLTLPLGDVRSAQILLQGDYIASSSGRSGAIASISTKSVATLPEGSSLEDMKVFEGGAQILVRLPQGASIFEMKGGSLRELAHLPDRPYLSLSFVDQGVLALEGSSEGPTGGRVAFYSLPEVGP